MQFTQLFDDDRAVSPVIGVILMVAITVILAAVIGTFVLGMSDQMGDTAPKASFGFNTASAQEELVVTHESGATITSDNLEVKSTADFSSDSHGPTKSATWTQLLGGTAEDVSAGSTLQLEAGTYGDNAGSFGGATLRVVYNNPDSDSTTTLQKFEVPN